MTYHLSDGAAISYIGDGHDGRRFGERGQLLTTSGRVAHVKWSDHSITPHDVEDLAPVSLRGAARAPVVRDDLDDSLDVGPLVATGMRAVLDTEGSTGVLNAMASAGSLGEFPAIAEELVGLAEQRIRTSASFREVAAQLDDDEFDELSRLAAHVLLRDAFSGEVEG